MWSRLATFLAAGVLIAPGAPAQSLARSTAPPGNSAVDQYVETVPSITGRPGGSSHAAGPGGGPALPLRQRAALEARSPALARFVDRTGVPHARTAGPAPGAKTFTGHSTSGSAPLPSAAWRVLSGTDSQAGGMGAALPIVLVLIALGGILISLVPRDRPS